jgi:hypothetical protein
MPRVSINKPFDFQDPIDNFIDDRTLSKAYKWKEQRASNGLIYFYNEGDSLLN